MRQKVSIIALLLGSALWLPPAFAQERIIGLLALPEVFGGGACDHFIPRPVQLREAPQGPVVGTVFVVKPWTHHDVGGCEGLEVGVRRAGAPAGIQALPTMEYGYEEPGAIVLERRGQWFRVRLATGSAWLEASAQNEFHEFEQLLGRGQDYLTEAWNGHVAASPGSVGRPAKSPRGAVFQPVHVRRTSRQNGDLWFLVDVMSHSECEGGGEPTVTDSGWVPAYGRDNEAVIWFSPRGC